MLKSCFLKSTRNCIVTGLNHCLVIIAVLQILRSFPSALKEKTHLSQASNLSIFLKMKTEAKPHQEEVKGDLFHCRTKVPFMKQLGRIQEHPQRGENVGFSHHPLFSFPDLKINKRQVQQHSGRHNTKSCGCYIQPS